MSYNRLSSVPIIVSGDMSASLSSSIIEVKLQDNIGIQLNWTGTPTGTFDVQVSDDYFRDFMGNVINAGNWITLTLSPAIIASGAADKAFIDINQTGASYMKVIYTRVSGTGTLNGFMSGKGV